MRSFPVVWNWQILLRFPKKMHAHQKNNYRSVSKAFERFIYVNLSACSSVYWICKSQIPEITTNPWVVCRFSTFSDLVILSTCSFMSATVMSWQRSSQHTWRWPKSCLLLLLRILQLLHCKNNFAKKGVVLLFI